MSADTAPSAAELLAKLRAPGDDGEALQLLQQLLQPDTPGADPDSASRPVRTNPGASMLNAAIYRTAVLSLLELLENAEGAGAKRFFVWVESVAGQPVLMFCDDGHGVQSNSIERVIDAGYTNGQLAQPRERNRMFHRGFVVTLDSLAADAHVFSRAKGGPLQVMRYGPALTSQLEERRGYDQAMETVAATFDADGAPMRDDRPAPDKVKELLIHGAVFAGCDDLHARIMGARAKCGFAADAPCFGGMMLLKPALGIVSSVGDLTQGSVSLRAACAQRYLAAGTGLFGVVSRRCELILQGEPVEKQSWDRDTMAFSTRLKRACPELGYNMELLIGYEPPPATTTADRQATTRYRHPALRAVLAGSNIVVEVASLFPQVEKRFFEQLAQAGWSRRQQKDNRLGQLSGYERYGFLQLAAMAAGKEHVGNGTDSLCAFIAADGSAITRNRPRTVVKKDDFIVLNKEMRAVMGGEGVTAIVVITPRAGTVPNPADLLSPDKTQLTNVQLKTAARTFLHQALLHCASDAFEAMYDGSPLWNAVIQEREQAAQAARDAEEEERRAAEAEEAAQAAAALAAQAEVLKEQQAAAKRATAEAAAAEKEAAKAEQRERDAKRKRDDEAHAKLAERHARRNAQQAEAAAAAAAAAGGGGLRRSSRNRSGDEEMEEDEEEDVDEAAGDETADGRAAAGGRAAGGRASGAAHCCQYCRTTLSARAAGDAKRRLDEDLDARVAAKDARIQELEALVRIMQGRE
jgi:hypothetical protein